MVSKNNYFRLSNFLNASSKEHPLIEDNTSPNADENAFPCAGFNFDCCFLACFCKSFKSRLEICVFLRFSSLVFCESKIVFTYCDSCAL